MSEEDRLKQRCATAALRVDYVPRDSEEDPPPHFVIRDTSAGTNWGLIITDVAYETESVLNTQFEYYRPLSGYDAMWSQGRRIIECELVGRLPAFPHARTLMHALFHRLGRPETDADAPDACIILPTAAGTPRVSVRWMSPELRVWRCVSPAVHLLHDQSELVSLVIEDSRVRTDDDARRWLEAYGTAALLELDRSLGISLRLRAHRSWGIRFIGRTPRPDIRPLTVAPDIIPTSLFWQGRSAETLPTQFLGFYQVLEYYFPRCSRLAFVRELHQVRLGSQTLVAQDDIQVLKAAARMLGRGLGSERAQIKATLETIVTEHELRSFLEQDEHLRAFYAKPVASFVESRIHIEQSGRDLRQDTAVRLYDIRCKLVHTKEDAAEHVFRPFSSEIDHLVDDITLIRFLARRALEEMADPLPQS